MGQTGKLGLDCLIYKLSYHTNAKFIIPACMDTVVELDLGESLGFGADGLIGGRLNGSFLTYRMDHDTDT